MEAIRNYLDSMFLSLPRTAEILQMKEDLLMNMEDKYNELRLEGRSENEAIGIVIAEFGNIEELARELNIDLEQPNNVPMVDLVEAEEFVDNKKKSGVLVAAGVFLCITGVAMLLLISSVNIFQILGYGFSSASLSLAGIIVLLLFVAVAVGLFIYSGTLVEPYKYLEGEFYLNSQAESYAKTQKELFRNRKTYILISSVLLFILSPVSIFITSMFDNQGIQILGVVFLLLMIAVGVTRLIIMGNTEEAFNILLQYRRTFKKGKG